MSGAAADERREEAARAGRGVLFTMGAKALFVLTGFVVQVALPRLLVDPAQWGRYSTVATLTSIVTNTLVAATVQTVSKRTSEDEGDAVGAQREGLRAGVVLAIVFGGGFALLSPWLASSWQHDASLAPLFATSSIVIASYAIYSAQIGAVNGRRRFSTQAAFDTGFALARSTAIVTGAWIAAATGAVVGWAAVAVAVVAISAGVLGTGKGSGRSSARAWLAFFAPVAIYQAALNGVLQADQPLFRANLAAMALEAGRGAAEAADLASRAAGFYRAAQTFAFVPYQIVLAVTFVVFPTVSRATSLGDADAARRAVRGAMRFSLIVLLAMAAPIAGASDGVMRVAYPAEYLAGAPALGVLSLGLVPFSLFTIAASILAGAGRARTVAAIAVGAAAVVIAGNYVAVRSAGLSDDAPIAAALATSLGATIALGASGVAVHRATGAFLPIVPTVRTLAAAAVAYVVAWVVPHGSALGAIVACAAGALAFVAALFALRELGADDLALVRRVVSRRR